MDSCITTAIVTIIRAHCTAKIVNCCFNFIDNFKTSLELAKISYFRSFNSNFITVDNWDSNFTRNFNFVTSVDFINCFASFATYEFSTYFRCSYGKAFYFLCHCLY